MFKHNQNDPEDQWIDDSSDIEMADPDAQYSVLEHIIDHRTRYGEYQYLCKWKGVDEDENTWEPADKIEDDAPQATIDFHRMIMNKDRRNRARKIGKGNKRG